MPSVRFGNPANTFSGDSKNPARRMDPHPRGIIDVPKTEASKRRVAIAQQTAVLLKDWMTAAVDPDPGAFVFAGETGRPVWRDTLQYDHIRPKLKSHFSQSK
jgi:hypothetical protein